jgi:hypothetical protein
MRSRTSTYARMGRPSALERRLGTRLRAWVALEVHDNTHTMITFQRQREGWRVRAHHMFVGAPEDVIEALARYIQVGDGDSSSCLDRFIEQNRALIRRLPADEVLKRQRIDPRGRHHDLSAIYSELNQRCFGGRVRATITWGPASRTRGMRHSIKMGSYSADARLIRIHPALDQQRVPRYFVEWIVFHEMLHDVHPARVGADGRRCVHTPEFVAAERTFYAYERARDWEDANLDLLLRS